MAYAGSVRLSPWKVPALVDLPLLKLILQILLAVFSLLAIMLVLLHKGRGGGLSDMFGGGVGAAAGGSTVMEKNLDRITIVVAVGFVFTTIGLALILST